MGLETVHARPLTAPQGDEFAVLEDHDVRFSSKGHQKLPIPLRRLRVQRENDGKTITLVTNDLNRSAGEIAALYKGRWQIELLFRWIEQHLGIRKFLGANDNAIRLQVFAAMIAFALLRIAARTHGVEIPILRFTGLVAQCLFERRQIAAIERPPPVNPSKRKIKTELKLCLIFPGRPCSLWEKERSSELMSRKSFDRSVRYDPQSLGSTGNSAPRLRGGHEGAGATSFS